MASCYTNKFFHPCHEICQDLVSQASRVKSIYLRIYGEHNFAINLLGGRGCFEVLLIYVPGLNCSLEEINLINELDKLFIN